MKLQKNIKEYKFIPKLALNKNIDYYDLKNEVEKILNEIKQNIDNFLKENVFVSFYATKDFTEYNMTGCCVSIYHFFKDETWVVCEIYFYYENDLFDYVVYNLQSMPKHIKKVVKQVCKIIEKTLNKYCKKTL